MIPPNAVCGHFRISAAWLKRAALCLVLAPLAHAQTAVYWDTNGSATGSSNTTDKTWQQSSGSYWSTNGAGTSSTTNWSSVATGNKIATFSAGTNATGTNTIAVSGTINDVAGLNFQEGNVTLNGSGTLTLTTSTPTFTVAGSASATIGATLAQSAYSGFTKDGTGNLTLSGNNTFGDKVTASAGTLTLAADTALGTNTWGNTVSSGATLALTGNISVDEGSFNFAGAGSSSGGAIRNASGTNTLGGMLVLTDNATITSAGGSLTATGQVSLGYTLTVNGAGNTTLSGDINGSGNLTKSGTGTLTLAGSGGNSNSGMVAINDGTLALAKAAGTNAIGGATVNIGDGSGAPASAVVRLDASNQIADYAGTITINADGVLQVNNFTEGINLLAGTGLIDLSTSGYLSVGVNSGSSSFGGSITGTGTLEKVGAGTLTLTSDLSFGGVLEVSAGTLAYGSGVRDFDATLKLDGGTLSLSNTNLSVTTLLVTSNSIIDFGGTNATLNLDMLTISEGVTLTVQNWANAADFFYTQNWTGASFNVTGSPMNRIAFTGYTSPNSTHWQAYDRQITPVPEPSAYGAALLALSAGLLSLRRRTR